MKVNFTEENKTDSKINKQKPTAGYRKISYDQRNIQQNENNANSGQQYAARVMENQT